MKLRAVLFVLVFVLLISTTAFAAEKPAMDLPAYKGAVNTMEINLTNDDLLPMLKAAAAMVSGQYSGIIEKINMEDVYAALKDVSRIEFVQQELTKSNAADSDISDFYAKNAASGEWNRVFYQSAGKMGTVGVFAKQGGNAIYGFKIQSATKDNKPVKEIMVAKIEGKIDLAKLLIIASKVIQMK